MSTSSESEVGLKFHFLKLPKELRDMVYAEDFATRIERYQIRSSKTHRHQAVWLKDFTMRKYVSPLSLVNQEVHADYNKYMSSISKKTGQHVVHCNISTIGLLKADAMFREIGVRRIQELTISVNEVGTRCNSARDEAEWKLRSVLQHLPNIRVFALSLGSWAKYKRIMFFRLERKVLRLMKDGGKLQEVNIDVEGETRFKVSRDSGSDEISTMWCESLENYKIKKLGGQIFYGLRMADLSDEEDPDSGGESECEQAGKSAKASRRKENK